MDFVQLQPEHDDVVNDIVFSYHGKRFASCSSDKKIKVWTFDESKGIWFAEEIASRAHQDSIWRVSWTHPEFGQLLASCSEDCTVKVWEEQEIFSAGACQTRWALKATFTDCKKPVNDVKFSHRSLGLRLAAAGSDGCLRVYDARNIFDLGAWTMEIEHQVGGGSVTCICWNDCPFEPAKIAVGTASKTAIVYTVQENRLIEECMLVDGLGAAISDIAWAPSMGRSMHLIATASKETCFRIHQLRRRDDGHLEHDSTVMVPAGRAAVWRVAWNATGTCLATSAEDGTLCIWRKNTAGQWTNVQSLPSDMENKMTYVYSNP